MQQNNETHASYLKPTKQHNKIELHIFQRLKGEGSIKINTKKKVEAQGKEQQDNQRLLPTISQKGLTHIYPTIKPLKKTVKEVPKMNPILKYHSQKWLESFKGREQQTYLYKGKKKFNIQTISLSQPKIPRPRYSEPSSLLSLKKNSNEFYNQISKKNKPKKSLASSLAAIQYEQAYLNIHKGYYKFSDAVSGWNTKEIDDPLL